MSLPSQAARTMDARARAACARALTDALFARPEVLVACLHGSFQEGLAFRDVDVAIWIDPSGGFDLQWEYAADLAIALSQAVGLTVDVQVLNSAPLTFRYHALRGEPLVVRDAGFLADLRAATWSRYFDFQRFALDYWREAVRG
jgi:hypothetical protein